MSTYILYAATLVFLFWSFLRDRDKTILALKKARNSFFNILPQFLAILIIVGIILAFLSPQSLQNIIGSKSGLRGMVLASLLGSVTIIPVFVVLPIAAELLKNGAGLMQVAVFICTLTTVGFATMPLETKYFGLKVTLLRNILAYIFSFAVAFLIGVIAG